MWLIEVLFWPFFLKEIVDALTRHDVDRLGYPKGQFCGLQPPEGREAYFLNQQNAVRSALRDYGLNLPVIFNMNFEHTDPQMIIPNGGTVLIDVARKTISFN